MMKRPLKKGMELRIIRMDVYGVNVGLLGNVELILTGHGDVMRMLALFPFVAFRASTWVEQVEFEGGGWRVIAGVIDCHRGIDCMPRCRVE
jgi:hypothetical protein